MDADALVRGLCDALASRQAEAIRPFLADDVVYHNIPLDPVVGADAAVAFVDSFFGMCQQLEIEIRHLATAGDVVLTERVDTMTVDGVAVPLPVMGTFEIRDGRVAAWRDYFDLAQVTALLS